MDWKLFSITFLTIFVAELGDKTQFAAVAASAQSKSWVEVLLAVILALSLAGTLGVVAGKFLSHLLDEKLLKYASGSLFVLMGLWILLKR